MRSIIFIIFLLFVSSVNATEIIKIGVTLGLTGKYSKMSDMQMKGFRLWETDINKKGGILGKKVKIIIYDDNSNPNIAKSLYKKLIFEDKVDLLFGPYSSGITEAILPLTEKYKYPLLLSGASANRLWQKGYKYIFGIFIPASKYAVGFLEMLLKNGLTKIAIVYADDSFSKDIAIGTKTWAKRFNLKVLIFKDFKKGTKNFDKIAKEVKKSNAEVLIVCGHFNESVNMRLALKNIDWYPKAYFASVGPVIEEFYKILKSDANYTFSSSQWEYHETKHLPESKKFYESFFKIYKKKPTYHAATAYAAGQILEAAIKKTGTLQRDKIRDRLSTMETMSIIGRYGVDKTGMQIKHFPFIIQWQNGKKEIIWPEEFMTSKPIFFR